MPWSHLPTEMKLAVVELLDSADVTAFSKVDKEAYSLAVPALWRVSYTHNFWAAPVFRAPS